MIHLLRQLSDDWRDRPYTGDTVASRLPQAKSSCELSTGRAALMHLLGSLRVRPSDSVLVPGYVAEGVMRPLHAAGVRVVRYQLTPELQPDLDDLSRLLATEESVRLLIVVHMLGREAKLGHVRQLAHDSGTLVLDDCAQSLLTDCGDGRPLGSEGDFALFSLNKFLPVPDGAVLSSTVAEVDVSVGSDAAAPLPGEAIDSYLEHLHLNAQLLAARELGEAKSLLARSATAYDGYYRVINATVGPVAVSASSGAIRGRWNAPSARKLRQRNAAILDQGFPEGPLKPLWPHEEGAAPFAVPAMTPAGFRESVVSTGMRHGVLLSTLVDRWNFVPLNPARFQAEREYLARHVLIPVNEFLSEDQMYRIVETLTTIQSDLRNS
jgi:dTDP-4-amino-4,6-dideoxygalactose transaminase